MSKETEVPMVCVDCGGTLTNDDAIWSSSLSIFSHINFSQCFTSLNERLTAATQRAEAAEAKLRDVAYWHEAWKEAEAEREALRNIILWALGENGEFPERPRSDSHNLYPFYWWRTEMRKRLDTAMAVQPTTGDKHE